MNTINLNKNKYKSLFNIPKNRKLKNIISEYIDDKNKRQKKITSVNNNLKINNFKQILGVRYSTECGKKIDITNIILKQLQFENNKFLKTLDSLTCYLNKFFHKYISYFCGRCEGQGHHNGIINTFLTATKRYDKKMLDNFYNDTEHGFFHGLMTAFICYLINEDNKIVTKIDSLEKTFISATLHDFLKANGIEQKLHDTELKQLYSNLNDETYVHSDPPEKFYNKHLIIADRLELRRYPDYLNWVDERFHNLYKIMKPETKDMLDIFYNCLRPALEYIYTNRKETFIRHGTEVEQSKIEPIFPPEKTSYYTLKNVNSKVYPIEIDIPPFCSIINNEIIEGNKWYNDNQNGFCSNHDGLSQWNIIKGYIASNDFSKNGKIINSLERDHLFAHSLIQINKWVFLYQNLDKPQDLNNMTKDTNYLDSKLGIDPFKYLSLLIEGKNRVISQDTVFVMFQFIRMFHCRIVVLQ